MVALQLWGCGGVAAAEAQAAGRERRRMEARKAAKGVAKASIAGTGWKDDERGPNADKMILELAGAHTSYNPNQQM